MTVNINQFGNSDRQESGSPSVADEAARTTSAVREVSIEAIEPIECEGRQFIVDVNNLRLVPVTATAWHVLRRLKESGVRTACGDDPATGAVLTQLGDLEEKRVLSSTRRDFLAEAEAHLTRYRAAAPPVAEANLMVAQDCNLACRYCYGGHAGQFGRRGLMTVETAEQAFLSLLGRGGDRRFQKTVFLGGEPLLNLDVIQAVVRLWQKCKSRYPGREMYFATTTNATLITPVIARLLKTSGVGICVSLDGPQDMHDANRIGRDGRGSFERVMAGIENLRAEGVAFSVRVTLTYQTDLARLADFLESTGFETEYVGVVDSPRVRRDAPYQFDGNAFQRLTEAWERLRRAGIRSVTAKAAVASFATRQVSVSLRDQDTQTAPFPFRCGAGWSLLTVDADGTIYPCQRLAGRSGYDIGTIVNGVDCDRVVALYRCFLASASDCESCWALSRCRRQCLAHRAIGDGAFGPTCNEICNVFRGTMASSLLSDLEIQRGSREQPDTWNEAITRFDGERLMKEHKARLERS